VGNEVPSSRRIADPRSKSAPISSAISMCLQLIAQHSDGLSLAFLNPQWRDPSNENESARVKIVYIVQHLLVRS